MSRRLTRRELLKIGASAGAASLASFLPGCCALHNAVTGTGGTTSTSCAKITDIEHVVIFIQENRSFDHYFGSYKGVRGFADTSAAFHHDTSKMNSACTHDITHDWVPQHQSWNSGAMNGFVTSRQSINANDAILTMGYYNRGDLPLYYAVADAFTLCDNYFCSVIGPTDPNRLYTMAASIDPDGKNGGPLLQTLIAN